MTDKNLDVRKTGKVHWHEEIVRPIKVSPRQLIQRSPKNDMVYAGKDRKHNVRDVELPMRCFNVHISEIPVGRSSGTAITTTETSRSITWASRTSAC